MNSETQFNYFVSAKGIFMVISMIGAVNDKTPQGLTPLQRDIENNGQATVVIFNFRDLTDLSGDALQTLAQVQKDIRARAGGEVRLCGLKPELRAKLLSRGIVRTSEIYDNLQVAIQLPAKPQIKKAS